MIYPVIIVGGGFSGLVLANLLNDDKINYLLIEKNDRLGKKILATGNGRGNVSNLDLSLSHYHGKNPSFCEYAIKNFDNRLIGRFFESKGVLLSNEGNRIYPSSKQANGILDCLRLGLNEKNILLSTAVTDIVYDEHKKFFTVTANGKEYFAENVVLSVGGAVGEHFGTDGSSYRLVEKFGHKVSKLYPSLVQLTADKESVKGLKGVKETAEVKAFSDDRFLSVAKGDLLFTDNGVSGNTVFFLSSYLTDVKNPSLKVNFIPDVLDENAVKILKVRKNTFPKLSAESFLSGLVHSRISYKICSDFYGKKTSSLKYEDITDKDISNLVKLLKNTVINITGTCGFKNAQVTRGGIDTTFVNNATMQSKIIKGLYFTGEVLDVDGDCGGYNLQWAFSSATCAYRSIIDEK